MTAATKKNRSKAKKTPLETRLTLKKTAEPKSTIASAWQITLGSTAVLRQNWQLFSGIMLIYALAYLVLVQGLGSVTSVASLKSEFASVYHGHLGSLFTGLGVFALLIGSSSTNSNPAASSYQSFLILIVSLVIIWTLRQIYSGTKVRIRDGYYKGLYPLIPFILVLVVIGIQLIPLVIGSTLYNLVITGGVAVNLIEKLISLIIIIGLMLASLYFISSSIFAIYIVTLPDMTPIKALRSAKGLVKGRRLLITRKLIYLPVMLLIVTSVIMLPFILIIPAVAVWIFFILSLGVIVVVHSYLYSLYRELIK